MSTESEARPWLVLAGCFLIGTGFNAYVFAPASIMPPFVAAFGIDKPAAGLAISVVFLAWALLQVPGGLLMDRYDNRVLVWIGVVVFLVAAVAGLFAPTYPTFLATRFVGGATAVFLWTANANIVGRSFPQARRAAGTRYSTSSWPRFCTIIQIVAA